ncbi:short-subunit dehydrogenase [Nicoletella semolina]|uniref:Short-subunit dehydrogenase n=1 Tax=Nicoletella semolina TaxID=271160 RepID=A0A4R2NCI5_9PAST|nr:SDR family NAD(P)-dependent oxidoreductase [Nicoletella semolina]MDH2924273.1 short-chain dehydrogenase [Nicoletella semolina]TCP18830.1 short-subunit dehydrogenase [Nicoletella semolina]
MKPTIFITGCSSGIGYATAHYLQQQGWHVIASCRHLDDVQRLQSEGLECLQLDVTCSEQIQQVFAYLASGRLDAIFCNAGYGQPGLVEDISREALREIFETNVFGAWEVINHALTIFRQQNNGRIIINSSILGFAAMHFRGAYNSTKFALEGMADTLRHELYGSNIYVSLLEPGPIESQFRPNSLAKLHQYIDLKQVNNPIFYQQQLSRLTKQGNANPFTLPALACAKACLNALKAKKPKARYLVTFPTSLFWWLRRLLPTTIFDFFCRKAGG